MQSVYWSKEQIWNKLHTELQCSVPFHKPFPILNISFKHRLYSFYKFSLFLPYGGSFEQMPDGVDLLAPFSALRKMRSKAFVSVSAWLSRWGLRNKVPLPSLAFHIFSLVLLDLRKLTHFEFSRSQISPTERLTSHNSLHHRGPVMNNFKADWFTRSSDFKWIQMNTSCGFCGYLRYWPLCYLQIWKLEKAWTLVIQKWI